MASRTDHVQALQQDYVYDRMNRLVTANLSGQGANVAISAGVGSIHYQYDALGNLTYKSDIFGGQASNHGSYRYGKLDTDDDQHAGPHAVSYIAGVGNFSYDANGNQLTGHGRTIDYAPFNKPTRIDHNGKRTDLEYGAERQLIKQVEEGSTNVAGAGGTGATTTLYVGGLYETIQQLGTANTLRHHIAIAGRAIAVVETQQSAPDVVTKEHYLHKNHQNSVIAITDHEGKVVERRHYDAFGALINYLGNDNAANTLHGALPYDSVTDLSFTGHRFLSSANVIHMKGRVYDPVIGRFLSADPHIQSPLNSQSLNRYSYVLNNPLSLTDPSGYFFSSLLKKLKKLFNKIKRIIKKLARVIKKIGKKIAKAMRGIQNWAIRQMIKVHELYKKIPGLGDIAQYVDDQIAKSSWAQAVLTAVATAIGLAMGGTAGAAAGAAAAQAYITYTQGGTPDQIRRGARAAAAISYLGSKINIGKWLKAPALIIKAINQGLTNGIVSKISGGSFSKNFARSFVVTIAMPLVIGIGRWVVTQIVNFGKWVVGQVKSFFERRAFMQHMKQQFENYDYHDALADNSDWAIQEDVALPEPGLEGVYPETFIGGGRALYAAGSKALKLLPSSEMGAKIAVSSRNFFKRLFRGPLFFSNYRIKSYPALLQRYGSNQEVINAAARTNMTVNHALTPLLPVGIAGEISE